jgi:carboxylesterase type B
MAVDRDVVYAADTGQELDVYRPATTSGAPVVVFFYGGRWQDGNRRQYAFVGKALAANWHRRGAAGLSRVSGRAFSGLH